MKKPVLLFIALITSSFFVLAQQDSVQISPVDSYMSEISLYPNPTERFIHISSSAEIDQSVTVRVFNLMGNLELNREFNPVRDPILKLDLMDLKRGLYFVNIEAGERKVTKRIYVI